MKGEHLRRRMAQGKHRRSGKGLLIRNGALLGLALVALGCARVPMKEGYPGPAPLPEAIAERYAYAATTGPVTERMIEKSRHYTLRRITFPSPDNLLGLETDITIDYFDIRPAGRAPVVMFLPIYGGTPGWCLSFARYFAEHGFAAVLVHRQEKYRKLRDFQNLDTTFKQMVIDHRLAIDWIETRSELDPSRIGVFGLSMGGIKGALLDALEQRIAASVLVLPGGDIPYILTHSEERGLVRQREALMEKEGLLPHEFYQRLRRSSTIDPLRLAPYIDARRTLMILARFDRVVPFATGERLRRQIGYPETIYLLSGHYSALLFAPYVKTQALDFFHRQFGNHQIDPPADILRAQADPGPPPGGGALPAPEPPAID